MYNHNDIVTDIKLRRLEWLGHVLRIIKNTLPRIPLDENPDGKRKVGRPRLRWFDDVQADLKKTGIKRWRRLKAMDRNDWEAVMREAKARLKGP